MRAARFMENFISKFAKDETTTLAASLAFYTALSLAPLLILFVTVASQIGPEIQAELVASLRSLVGTDAAMALEIVIAGAKNRPDLSSVAGFFGVSTLLFSAGLIFGELRSALNRIFSVRPRSAEVSGFARSVGHWVKDRFLHIGFALSFVFVLIATLAVSSLISATVHSHVKVIAALINILVSVLSYICLFTLMYRYLPDRRQPLRRSLRGGVLTACLFVLGKELIALYIGRSAIGSAYGAAGSIIVLLVWVYYSTLITFVGAQVSALWTKNGSQTV